MAGFFQLLQPDFETLGSGAKTGGSGGKTSAGTGKQVVVVKNRQWWW